MAEGKQPKGSQIRNRRGSVSGGSKPLNVERTGEIARRISGLELEFSEHALERMRERGITRQEVVAVVKNPQQRRETNPARDGAHRLERTVAKGRRVVVIAEERGQSVRVVTAFLT